MITKQAASNEMRQAVTTIAVILMTLAPHVATGQDLVQVDFSFKRVKVGSGLPGKRITVQIDPAAQALALAALPKDKPREAEPAAETAAVPAPASGPMAPLTSPTASRYAWFWDEVAPELGQVSGRFPKALSQLSQGPGGTSVAAPRLQQMQNLADNYGTEILKATIGTQVSPALVLAVIGIESAGETSAESAAGAQGLMQLMPATAARFGVSNAKDAVQNIKGGVAYLDFLMKTFDRDPLMVIAAYNAGEGAVKANAGVPPYAETRDYVPKVLAAWQVAQGLCLSPPELMTDPCVFKVISASN
jgi:soluble lytic murein transglycosylase-like protein